MTSQIRGQAPVARALWYEQAGKVGIRQENLENSGAVIEVATSWTGISRGTERLILSGRVPASEFGRMRAPFQAGDFPFPVKYGYSAVGEVVGGEPGLIGKAVFALHPHQDRFFLPAEALIALPAGLPPRRATLAANMETALNAVWDSRAGPGDQIAVVGAGLVGLLIAYLCAQLPGARVTIVDPQTSRGPIAESFGAVFASPELFAASGGQAAGYGSRPLENGADIVFHTSATPQGLASALSAAGFEGRVVEVSWYGAGEVAVPLGGAFHSRRLHLISSQVGHVAASRRARWPHRRRLALALDLLCDDRLDALITDEFAFDALPELLPDYLNRGEGIAAVVRF